MPLTAAELTVEIQETNRRLTDAIDRLRTEVTELRKDVGWVIKIGSSIGGLLIASMLGILGFAYSVDQRAGRIEASVAVLRKDSADLAQAMERIEKSLAQNHQVPEKTPR